MFPKLLRGSVEELRSISCASVMKRASCRGAFFEMPQHFRIGLGGEPEMTREALLATMRSARCILLLSGGGRVDMTPLMTAVADIVDEGVRRAGPCPTSRRK